MNFLSLALMTLFALPLARATDFQKLNLVIEVDPNTGDCQKTGASYVDQLMKDYGTTLFQFQSLLKTDARSCDLSVVYINGQIPLAGRALDAFQNLDSCLAREAEIRKWFVEAFRAPIYSAACTRFGAKTAFMIYTDRSKEDPSLREEYLEVQPGDAWHLEQTRKMILEAGGLSPLTIGEKIHYAHESKHNYLRFNSWFVNFSQDFPLEIEAREYCEAQIPDVAKYLSAIYGQLIAPRCVRNPDRIFDVEAISIGTATVKKSWWNERVALPENSVCMDSRDSTIDFFRSQLHRNAQVALCTTRGLVVAGPNP